MLVTEGTYDHVSSLLIQDWVRQATASSYDLAIFGDVLEHLKPKEIHWVIAHCRKIFKHIIIICPLHDIFQDEHYGNPLEVHQSYITSDFFDRYDCVEKHIVKGDEYTIMSVHILDKTPQQSLMRKIAWAIFHRLMLVLQPLGLARPFVSFCKRHLLKYKKLLRG